MSYNGQDPLDREQLETSLNYARRHVEWSLRIAIIAAVACLAGVGVFIQTRDPRSLTADIAAYFVIFGGLVFMLSIVVWGVQRYKSADFEIQMDRYGQSQADLATINQSDKRPNSEAPEIDEWIINRVRPEPQPFGVSDEGAEHLTAQWLQYLGFEDAQVTKYSGDGGIDVETFEYVCQVKNYRDKSVSVTEIRELYGVAASERKRAILFTATGVTTQGVDFADKNGIALIRFDAKTARLEEINDDGSDVLVNGEYEDL